MRIIIIQSAKKYKLIRIILNCVGFDSNLTSNHDKLHLHLNHRNLRAKHLEVISDQGYEVGLVEGSWTEKTLSESVLTGKK